MNDLSPGLREYYRAVERTIPGSGKDKKRYLNDIWDSLLNLQTECPNAGYDMAVDRIGELDELNDIWTQTMSGHKKTLKRRTKLFIISAVAMLLCISIFAVYKIGQLHGVYVESTTRIYEANNWSIDDLIAVDMYVKEQEKQNE